MITKLHFALYLLLLTVNLSAQSIFSQPTPRNFVNDYAGLLTEQEAKTLENKLQQFNTTSTNQIAIVCVKSLEGYSPAQFTHKLAQQWGVGQKAKNNGILMMVKPKYAHEKGQVYISVGYGLEHVIPDARAKRIVDQTLIPAFKKKKFYRGLDEAVDQMIKYTTGEYTKESTPLAENKKLHLLLIVIILFTLCLPILYLLYLKNRKVPAAYDHYYIHGAYNMENVFLQVEAMEECYNKKYTKFKKLIRKYNNISHDNLMKHADKIDRNMFCYLLDGRNRRKVFWEMSDPFLKLMACYMILLFIGISIWIFGQTSVVGLLISLTVSYVILNAVFSVLIAILEIYQFILRKNVAYLGGVSVSLFALNALLKRNIKKRYNSQSNTYSYYPHVYVSSGSYGGGYSGGFGGGFSGGGFGGGGFGGGGAGGGW